ncbi:MAG: hypothetical protein WD076_01565 [Parvularculaceae bacterium]
MSAEKTIRIAMWSGPRNISTTMMRAFENRADTVVVDEPFYACYLKASGVEHPYRAETLAAMPTDWREVRRRLDEPLPAGKSIFFEKHIAYHYPPSEPLDWLLARRTFLLIRDPRRMVASYARKSVDIAPIVESFAVERRIHDFLAKRGLPCPIVDAADVLVDPAAMMRALCGALAIPYTDRMLAWPAGPRATDGPWAPHWYDAVNASTGFKQAAEKPPDLTPALESIAGACAEDYRLLSSRRLRA